jgi:hypothetical protein
MLQYGQKSGCMVLSWHSRPAPALMTGNQKAALARRRL